MKKKLLLFFISITSISCYAQNVTDVVAKQIKGKLQITYNLEGKSNEKFDVKLFFFSDQTPETLVAKFQTDSDLGNNVNPGTDKIIYIEDLTQFQNVKGNIQFKVIATSMLSLISIASDFSGKKFKVGKTVDVSLINSTRSQSVQYGLFKDGKEVLKSSASLNKNNSFSFKIPKDKVGDNYEIKLYDELGNVTSASTGKFDLTKPKKFWLFGLGAGVAAGVVGVVTTGNISGNNSSSNSNGSSELPDPPAEPSGGG